MEYPNINNIIGTYTLPEPYASLVHKINTDLNNSLQILLKLSEDKTDDHSLTSYISTNTSIYTQLDNAYQIMKQCVSLSNLIHEDTSILHQKEIFIILKDNMDNLITGYKELKESYFYCTNAQLKRLDIQCINTVAKCPLYNS